MRKGAEHMKSILDPSFRYTNSVETDLKKTFARVRRKQRRTSAEAKTDSSNVQPITPKKRISA
jgi:hypothetical protein